MEHVPSSFLSLQVEHQLEEQLFNLYHKERRIDVIVDAIKEKQKELDKMVG
jgi:hypothetical protein